MLVIKTTMRSPKAPLLSQAPPEPNLTRKGQCVEIGRILEAD
jgi:hypothetical protein